MQICRGILRITKVGGFGEIDISIILLKRKVKKLEIIDIAKGQFGNGTKKVLEKYGDFFEEYFSTLEDREIFLRNIDSVLEKTDKELTEKNISFLSEKLREIFPLIERFINNAPVPGAIFFVGLNNFDGHGLIINGKPFAFFNMTRMNEMLKNKNFEVNIHLLHELFHALHYFFSPDFYMKNYKNIEHKYFKRMIAEGVATYFSMVSSKSDFGKAAWFGLLEEEQVKKWIEVCKSKKKEIQELLENSIRENRFDSSLESILFYVPGFSTEDLTKGRLGYYYGAKIVETAARKEGEQNILSLPYAKFRDYAAEYFEE